MCGLVGVISKNKYGFTRDQQDVFATLLFVDLLRGMDSTGVVTINNDGDAFVAKDAIDSLQFIQTKEYEEAQKRAFSRGMAMIGHNRKATKGTVVDRNAHPFNVDNNIILMHNGTMSEDHTKHADVEVDSHAIAHLIHEKKDVGEALGSFWGAYALIWYDVENATINFIRNSQRPLWWMETHSGWIWASTPDMLEFVRHRHGLKLITEPTELPEETLQQYKLLPNRDWETSNEKINIKRKAYVQNYGNDNYMMGGHQNRRGRFPDGQEYDSYEDYINRKWGDQAFSPEHRPRPASNVIQLPSPKKADLNDDIPTRTTIDLEPPEFAGCAEHERKLAKESNNVIPYGEFNDRIVRKNVYQWGAHVHVVPFDYTYVNGSDSSDGYYLYATPVDGDSILFRQYLSSKVVTEERILQLASGGYVYEYTVSRKSWTPLAGGSAAANFRNDTPGALVVVSLGCKLLSRPTHVPNTSMH